ncbi:hypothetical protein BGZ75_002490 [Mortierella antarctica]|nr:hypothetical protein BGZ75_002490 [Mortierella antarctica]
MATCRAWSQQFQPYLWTNLRTGKKLPGRNTLEQNLHRIRTIDLDLRAIRPVGSSSTNAVDFLTTLSLGLPMSSTASSSETVDGRECKQATEARVALCMSVKRFKAVLCRSLMGQEDSFWNHLRPLVHSNRNLTYLHLEFNGTPSPPILQAISALYRLQHLTIRGSSQKKNWFLSLLRACLPLPRLSEFYCFFAFADEYETFEGDSEDDPEDDTENDPEDDTKDETEGENDIAEPRGKLKTILEEAIAARTSENGSIDVKIRALRLPALLEGDLVYVRDGRIEISFSALMGLEGNLISVLLPILRSKLIEIDTFEVPEFHGHRSKKFYEEMARKYFPGLRHLIISSGHGIGIVHPATVCAFIRGASGLKTVTGSHFTDEYDPTLASIVSALAMHHFGTLEELELIDCKGIKSPDQQAILASCKHLKRFWVVPDDKCESEHGLRFQDILDGEWVCLGLRELCLTLDRTIDHISAKVFIQQGLSASGARELSKKDLYQSSVKRRIRMDSWAAKQVYTQIGQLVVLETLALGTYHSPFDFLDDILESEWDLTLCEGWLAELAGLKNLRHVQMRTDFWSRMGQAEVEFMDAEWPLLGDISFNLGKSELHDLLSQPHWQWLQQRRPHLRLTLPARQTTFDFWRPEYEP